MTPGNREVVAVPGAREANVLGALAQAITDRTAVTVAAATGQNVSAASALSALDQFLDRPTLDQLRRVLGLTPSGAVRLVDRLAEAGLVTRGASDDKRSRSVSLTDAGRAVARRMAAARSATLAELLSDLSPTDREILGGLLDRMMATLVAGKDGGAWVCRLCDLDACQRADGRCPAANAAVRRYGPAAAAGTSSPAAILLPRSDEPQRRANRSDEPVWRTGQLNQARTSDMAE